MSNNIEGKVVRFGHSGRIVRTVAFAISQPRDVEINTILFRRTVEEF